MIQYRRIPTQKAYRAWLKTIRATYPGHECAPPFSFPVIVAWYGHERHIDHVFIYCSTDT
ncbi:MAG: hypothetical protein KF852_04235 [Saprospiraceae bacterium]|nr:hypothetical protein [Saprospiraceae bacterium]